MDGFKIFNPGSTTARRRQPQHTMGLALVSGSAVTFRRLVLDHGSGTVDTLRARGRCYSHRGSFPS